jgi:predicted ribosome quality control (RQC) complex YloA/Tae2 family protein
MNKIILLILFFLFAAPLIAQDSLGNIAELQKLLKDRKDRFEAYATSADQHSGIFGNKTKKDLEKSREILFQIVRTDNTIFDELTRVISKRGMAKADYSYDEVAYKQTIDQLTQATDTLNKQLAAVKEINAAMEKKANIQQWVLYSLLGAIVLLTLGIVLKTRKPG